LRKINKKSQLEAVILAGGKSQRMGLDKAQLRVGRYTLLGHARKVARDLEIPSRVIRVDYRTGYGPLGGIETALRRTKTRRVLFLSCDMPFLSTRIVEALLETDGLAVFAEIDGLAGFPFCVKPELLSEVERRIQMGKLSLQSFAQYNGHLFCIPESDRPQMENINTPEQLAAARARLQ
tara:strand:- start:202 stop:738 length:537 start_codon:yes stop_codon:yes gene_type:complete